MKNKILSIILAVVTVISLASCGNTDTTSGNTTAGNATSGTVADNKNTAAEDKIKIAYLPITHALALFETAEELKENGVDVELVKYGSWAELLDAVNTGNVDGASVLIELAMRSKEQGIGVKAVALGHRDGNVVIVSNDINSAADLKGKTFAIPHRQSSHNILLNDTLAKAGLTVEDIKITELAPTEMPAALAGGQIDGYCVAEPFGAKAVGLGIGKVLYSSEELWENSLCCGLVLTDKFIENNHELAVKFVDAYKEAGNNIDKDKDKEKEIGEKYLNQDGEVLDISLQWISYDNLEITEDIYNVLADKVKSCGLSDNPPSYDEFVDNTL
ncbi:MAG: ABC transporter substrate-binding protein [Oscillospiraceae bacterium]|nr:ABC transporter substrate-binding protein [Oscillospiraceae bacterium]